MKIIRFIARILAGAVFIFSGFVKGIDLTGSAIKFEDYFQAFHLDFLHFLAFPLAFLFPATEFLIGVSLFFNIKPRIGAWGFFLFMCFFTPLTFILALFNPVKDCGCFGDAIVLTNWQTFYKNLILLAIALYLFLDRKHLTSRLSSVSQWILLLLYFGFFMVLSVYSYNHLPVFDFRPYKIGTYIPGKMIIPEGAPRDQYRTTLIYEKNGIRKEFSMDNYPWKDSTWKFIDQKSVLIRRGYIPPVHDFNIIRQDGTDITDLVLSDSSHFTFLLVSSDLGKASRKGLQKAWKLAMFAPDKGYGFYVLTPSGKEETDHLMQQGFSFNFCSTDETTCKTIIRSNPGLLLLYKGTILGKWHYHDIPPPEQLDKDLLSRQVTLIQKKSDLRLTAALILGFILLATLAYTLLSSTPNPKKYEPRTTNYEL